LTDYRLAVAKRLLDGGKSVAEVYYECGFGDSSHFIRTFRKKNGITPYEYKKR
jgi:AraC-like DNA-binding protein